MMVDTSGISTTDIGLGVVITIYAFDKLSTVLLKLRNGSNGNGNGHGSSFASPPTLLREFDRLGAGIEKLAEVTEQVATNQQTTAVNIDKLVAFQEQQQQAWNGDDRRRRAHGAGQS